MREIKFRGIHPHTQTLMDVCVIDWMHDEVFFEQGTDVSYPIDECKLMQFTGVFDKDGVEIYEGDVICDQYLKTGLVKWFKSDARFEVVDLFEITMNGLDVEEPAYELDTGRGWAVLNVVGNIHTNPEFLE